MFALRALLISSVLITTFAAAPAHANRPVGLGVAVGASLPNGPGELKIDPALAWGFFVDIPLISSFHITPSTVVYRLDSASGSKQSATDVSLNFKFMIPLGPLEPFVGLTGGVTSAQALNAHVGGLVGASLNLISNLDVFAQLNYRLTIQDGGNIASWYVFAGPLFRFQ